MTAPPAPLRLLCLVALFAFAAEGASGQAADTLVWEPVGDLQQATWLAFDADTLYAGTRADSDQRGELETAVLRPDSSEWVRASYEYNFVASDFAFFPDRTVYALSIRDLLRSTDGAKTFDGLVQDGVFSLPTRTPDGALVVGYHSATRPVARSTDDGATWTVPDGPDLALTPTHIEALPPGPDLPLGRVVGAGYGGIGYSDDGGRTWAPTAFAGGAGLAFASWALARIADGPGDGGHGGSLLAVVEGNGTLAPALARSADGLTWELIGPTPTGTGYSARLLAGPDGAVYFYDVSDTESHVGRPVWRTTDGGATWSDMGPVWTEWRSYPTDLAVGPDGRLWASARGEYQYGLRVGGVFRTTEPVFAVARNGGDGSSAAPFSLRVFPNPTSVLVTVEVSSPMADHVRLAVFDAQGREVAVVWDGTMVDGQRVVVETSGLGTGVYVVRAVASDGATASASLTVAL